MAPTKRTVLSFLLLTPVALSVDAAIGQNAPDLQIYRSGRTGHASFVSGKNGATIPVAPSVPGARVRPEDFLAQHGDVFGIADPGRHLRRTRSENDTLGQTHTTYQQIHAGIPVFSGILKVHQDAAGAVRSANGDFYKIPAGLNTR